jgi:hypothetical protein
MAEPVLKFVKKDGTIFEITVHPNLVGQTKQHYEKKGFIFVDPNAPAPTPAQEEAVAKVKPPKKARE